MDIGGPQEPVGLGEPVFPSRLTAPQVKKEKCRPEIESGDDGQRENDKDRRRGQKVIFW